MAWDTILFDLDGTLTDSGPGIINGVEYTVEQMGLPQAEEGKAILYMGHGTEHFANSCYALLEYVFRDMGRKDVVIGTVEGYPGFGEAVRRIKEMGASRVELRPLMIVAGDHAKNDLAGEEEDSWKSLLEQEGYAVNCVLQGLGEFPSIQALFVKHAKEGEQLQA